MRCLVVKWTGNGGGVGTTRDIQWSSVIFRPDIVLTLANPSAIHLRVTGKSHNIQTDADVTAGHVKQLYTDGFQVDGFGFNQTGTVYTAVAFQELGGELISGTYVGGSDVNRIVSFPDAFEPRMIWIGGPIVGVSPWLSSVDGNSFRAFSSTGFGLEPIEDFLPGGFKWSIHVDSPGALYKYVAFTDASAGEIESRSYVGNGPGANQTFTQAVTPKYVFWHYPGARDAGVFGQHHKSFHLAADAVQGVGAANLFDPAASVGIPGKTVTVQHPGGGTATDGTGIVNKGGQTYSMFVFDAYLITAEDEVVPLAVVNASPGNLFTSGWQDRRHELPFPGPFAELAREQRLTTPSPFTEMAREQSLAGRERGGVSGGGEGDPDRIDFRPPSLARGKKIIRGLTAKDARAFGRPTRGQS